MNSSMGEFWKAAHHLIDSFIGRLPALIVAIIVFLLFYGLSVFATQVIRRATPHRRRNLGVVFGRLAGGAAILLGLLVSFSIVAPSFQAADVIKILGIGGVAIGFAFQNIMQNFLAGLLLLWSEPFRVGDEIKLDAYEGTVIEIQTRATIIKTYDEREVVIPNADLFTHSVIVNTAFGARRWEYDLSIKSSLDLAQVKSQVIKAVQTVPGVLKQPMPEAFVVNLDSPSSESAKLRVLWWTNAPQQHQMLASYDGVLTAIANALVHFAAGEQKRAA
jgi:small conductance mechanosensitive channel